MAVDNVRSLAPRQAPAISMRSDSLDTLTVAKMLAESGFFGEVKDAGKALAKILAGAELGVGPIASLMGVYFTNGKITYSANIMASAVKRSPHYSYRVKRLDEKACVLEFIEGQDRSESPFTLEDAKTAGLLDGPNKHNWTKYPRNMLFARAMSNGCKWFCPDVFGGVTPYTPDELGAEVVMSDDGDMRPVVAEVVSVTPAPSAPRQSTPARPVQQQPEPAPVEEERARAMVGETVTPRQVEELRYKTLADTAVAAGHSDAETIKGVDPAKFSDKALIKMVEKLEAWLLAQQQPEVDEAF